MTDNTQELSEIIREMRYRVLEDNGLTVNGLTTIEQESMQAIIDWHNKQVKNAVATAEDNLDQYWNKELNKQVEAVLDRLESQSRRADDCTDDTLVVKMIRVGAERDRLNKLTEAEL